MPAHAPLHETALHPAGFSSLATDVIPHRVVYDAECSDMLASIDASLHVCQDTLREGAILRAIVDRAHDLLHRLSERLVENELALRPPQAQAEEEVA